MTTFKKVLAYSLATVLAVQSFSTVKIKAEELTETVISAEAVEEEALSGAVNEEVDLSAEFKRAAKKLHYGVASVSIDNACKEMSKSVASFSEYLEGLRKSSNTKSGTVNISVSSSSSDSRKHSDVLKYQYNHDFVKKVTDKEYEILCRIVEAEAGDQDVYGRILVANVILNRVNYKKEWKNDIEGVVFEKNQFSPISNGAYYRVTVDDLTKEAVDRCLEGEDYSEGAFFFFMRSGTSKSAASFFDSLKFVCKYGCHEFFKY